MRVLVACEESQEVCKAFRAVGHEAYSCDIQDCSGGFNEWHIKGDAISEAYSGKYDMMIAHPPCTYISRAGARWMYPKAGVIDSKRLKLAMEAKEFFLMLFNAPVEKIAIENPTPLRIVGLPPFTQSINPYQFGHPYSKRTLLWLKNLPELNHTEVINKFTPYLPSNTGGKKRNQKYSRGAVCGKKNFSKTFSGIAAAMSDQWG